MAATSETMQDLTAPVQASVMAPTSQGLQQGIQLAQAQQDMVEKQQRQQQMQQQLDNMKWNSSKDLINTYMSASPEVQKKLKPQLGKRLAQNGADPLVLDSLDNEDMAKNYRTAIDAFGSDPDAAAKGMAALQHVSAFEQTVPSLAEIVKQRNASQTASTLKQMQMENAQEVAGITAKGRVDAAAVSGGARVMNSKTQANNAYSREIGPSENAVYQANRAEGLINKIDEGDLKSTKTLSADLNSAVASLLAGGKPSTVYGQQATHADDLYERIQNAKQFLTASPQDTQAPAKLAQLKLDITALKDFYDEQHQQKYSAWRQGMDPKLQEGLDNRYKTFRKAQGLDTNLGSPSGPAPTQTPQPTAAPAFSATQQAWLQKAASLPGAPPQAQLVQDMKKAGIQ